MKLGPFSRHNIIGNNETRSGVALGTSDTEHHNNRRGDHGPRDRFIQEKGGKNQAEERLQKLQLANAGNPAQGRDTRKQSR